MVKVRILSVPTIDPMWIGKIGVIREEPFDFYKGRCYRVEIEDQESERGLALYENEFEVIKEE
jgi:hypothetical protein